MAAWVDQGLVDLIVPGCRSLDVDVQGFVEPAGGRDVPVYPCLDDHHGTDAYLNPGPELFRGVFVNWLSQGAAGAQTFNWTHASAATHARLGVRSLPAVPSHPALYQEAGSLETLRRHDRLHGVERRGGFRWTGGGKRSLQMEWMTPDRPFPLQRSPMVRTCRVFSTGQGISDVGRGASSRRGNCRPCGGRCSRISD